MRVVSLVPSVTETLAAWGIEPVAVTRFCERPELVHVGGTKDPDVAGIVALAPDLVVLCEEENRREDAEALAAAGLCLHVVRIDDVADVQPGMADLAQAVGYEGAVLGGDLPAAAHSTGVRAVVPIWRRPWSILGERCYGTSVLRHLGIEGVVVGSGRYPQPTTDELVAAGADVVLAPSEPYPFGERHRAELEQIAPVRFVDGADLFWWGWRTPAALGRLADALVDLR